MKKFRYAIAIVTLLLVISIFSCVFAEEREVEVIENYGGAISTECVPQGETVRAVMTQSGPVAQEPFIDSNGVRREAGTLLISKEEDGTTGNMREKDSTTFNSPDIAGNDGETLEVEVLAPFNVRNNNGEYVSPTFEVEVYTGGIYADEQSFIDKINEKQHLWSQNGNEPWTVESYKEYWEERADIDTGNLWRLYDESYSDSVTLNITFQNGKAVVELPDGMSENLMLAITGIGDGEKIITLNTFERLYSVMGEGEMTWEEFAELYDEYLEDLEEALRRCVWRWISFGRNMERL